MRDHLQLFRDDEVMAVACFATALLFMCTEQYWAACSLICGYVAGEIAYFLDLHTGHAESGLSLSDLSGYHEAKIKSGDRRAG